MMFVNRDGWRDQDRNEYILDVYKCECGAGKFIKTHEELFKKGWSSMTLEEVVDEQ